MYPPPHIKPRHLNLIHQNFCLLKTYRCWINSLTTTTCLLHEISIRPVIIISPFRDFSMMKTAFLQKHKRVLGSTTEPYSISLIVLRSKNESAYWYRGNELIPRQTVVNCQRKESVMPSSALTLIHNAIKHPVVVKDIAMYASIIRI